MRQPIRQRDRPRQDRRLDADQSSEQTFWYWFAIGVLIFCWIAEATMCAERGF